MAGRQARVLGDAQLAALLAWCDTRRYPLRDRAMVLLSAKAGLRAIEIALIRRRHVLDAGGAVDDVLHLEDRICKMGAGGSVPMAPALREALVALLAADAEWGLDAPLIRSERAWRATPGGDGAAHAMRPDAVSRWFTRAFRAIGAVGCSSHSGRRTFITRAARNITAAGGSMRDVQLLARHKSLVVTQRYIEGSEDAQRRVVSMI